MGTINPLDTDLLSVVTLLDELVWTEEVRFYGR